jgi:hypothetical protein
MNNLFNGFLKKEMNIIEDIEIEFKKEEVANIDDSLLYHPFIEELDDELSNEKNTYLIIYRINKHNEFNYIEYYLNNINCKGITSVIIENLKCINGIKRIKGYVKIGNQNFTIVQIRENKKMENWVTIWDIIINKHYYGEKIDEKCILFFLNYNKLDDLYIKDKICKKPIILYCYVNDKYKNYVNKNKTIQYCQNENNILINLSEFEEGDNVRNICFLDDKEMSNDLLENDYIIERKGENYKWVIKNDKNIISFLK